MSRRALLLVIAGALLFISLVLGFSSQGEDCGSVFRPGPSDTAFLSAEQAFDCQIDISNAKPLTYGFLGFAALSALLAIAVGREQESVVSEPSSATSPSSGSD